MAECGQRLTGTGAGLEGGELGGGSDAVGAGRDSGS